MNATYELSNYYDPKQKKILYCVYRTLGSKRKLLIGGIDYPRAKHLVDNPEEAEQVGLYLDRCGYFSIGFIILLIVCFFIFSCSQPCSGDKSELRQQYLNSLRNCNGSPDCAAEVKRQYEKRMENACD